jgi:hypothetical protein
METNPYIVDIVVVGKWGYCKQFNKSYSGKCATIWGAFSNYLTSKLINFGANMVLNFQGAKTCVITQL